MGGWRREEGEREFTVFYVGLLNFLHALYYLPPNKCEETKDNLLFKRERKKDTVPLSVATKMPFRNFHSLPGHTASRITTSVL